MLNHNAELNFVEQNFSFRARHDWDVMCVVYNDGTTTGEENDSKKSRKFEFILKANFFVKVTESDSINLDCYFIFMSNSSTLALFDYFSCFFS